MQLYLNGEAVEVRAGTLAALLEERGLGGRVVGTAVNEVFVAAANRETRQLRDGDRVEVVAPMQGG